MPVLTFSRFYHPATSTMLKNSFPAVPAALVQQTPAPSQSSRVNRRIYLLDVKSGRSRRLNAAESYQDAPAWDLGGKSLFYVELNQAFIKLMAANPATGVAEPVVLDHFVPRTVSYSSSEVGYDAVQRSAPATVGYYGQADWDDLLKLSNTNVSAEPLPWQKSRPPDRAPNESPAKIGRWAKVQAVRGYVTYQETKEGPWKPLRRGRVISEEAVIKTSPNSQVDLWLSEYRKPTHAEPPDSAYFRNGPVVRLKPNSTLPLAEIFDQDSKSGERGYTWKSRFQFRLVAKEGEHEELESNLAKQQAHLNELHYRFPLGHPDLQKATEEMKALGEAADRYEQFTEPGPRGADWWVLRQVLLDEKSVDSASVTRDPISHQPEVQVVFTSVGASAFADLTATNLTRRLAIIFDGRLVSAARINEKITGGRATITGNFTLSEAQALADVLNAQQR